MRDTIIFVFGCVASGAIGFIAGCLYQALKSPPGDSGGSEI